jgi:hypothetical protein
MSLTSEIRSPASHVRRFIDGIAPDLAGIARRAKAGLKGLEPVVRPGYSETLDFALAGTAADYRIRALFDPMMHRGHAVQRGLSLLRGMVGVSGLDGGVPFEMANPWRKKRKGVPDSTRIERFVASYEAFEAEVSPARRILDRAEEDRLVRYAAMFARIEGAARQGGLRALLRIGESAEIDEVLAAAATPEMVEDVRALAEGFAGRHADTVSGFVRAQVGAAPSAGAEIGGADVDIVVDGVLWDFKVTIKLQLRTEHLRQAVGYWLLETGDELGIRSIAIDLTRQGRTERFGILEDLLALGGRDPAEVRATFLQELREAAAPEDAFGA